MDVLEQGLVDERLVVAAARSVDETPERDD